MTNGKPSFKFNGHAKGFTAHFHRLDENGGLTPVLPMLGDSVLPEWGERREERLSEPYRFEVDAPRKRRLVAIDGLHTWAEGRDVNGRFETEVSVQLTGLEVVEMLYIDSLKFHMRSSRT